MKTFLAGIFLTFFASSFPLSNGGESLYSQVLITGASVSGTFKGVPSPGLVLVQKYNGRAIIHAKAGQESEVIFNGLGKYLNDPNIKLVIGIDLFFWDGKLIDCSESQRRLNSFFDFMIKAEGKRFVLGNIPPLKGQLSCASRLNSEMNRCLDIDNCYLLDQVSIFRGLSKEQRSQYFLDGLHLSRFGSQRMSVKIEKLLKGRD